MDTNVVDSLRYDDLLNVQCVNVSVLVRCAGAVILFSLFIYIFPISNERCESKMKFECFVCYEKFIDENVTINHLRKVHKIKEHSIELKCLLNFIFCQKTYLPFSGLRKHMKTCSKINFNEEFLDFQRYICAAKYSICFNIVILCNENNLFSIQAMPIRRCH